MRKDLDITDVVESLMKITASLGEPLTGSTGAVPKHEEDGSLNDHLYDNAEFFDDISGLQLDKKLATTARTEDIEFFRRRGVYTKRRREHWMKVITTKWIDQNKGDEANPNYRARLVGAR